MSIWLRDLLPYPIGVAAAAVAVTIVLAQVPQTQSPTGATVYFINLKDGDTVTSPFKVQFGLTGMGVAPAVEGPPGPRAV